MTDRILRVADLDAHRIARWESSPPEEIADIRLALLRMPPCTFIDAMKLLAMDG